MISRVLLSLTFVLIFSNRIFSLQALVIVNENFSLGYAYDSYGDDQLSGVNFKAHEIALRFKFGSPPEDPLEEEPVAE
tara:strand:+ start:1865 stop:2098 length:234 start_codon:yes stop_codon:yes gene_type:complete